MSAVYTYQGNPLTLQSCIGCIGDFGHETGARVTADIFFDNGSLAGSLFGGPVRGSLQINNYAVVAWNLNTFYGSGEDHFTITSTTTGDTVIEEGFLKQAIFTAPPGTWTVPTPLSDTLPLFIGGLLLLVWKVSLPYTRSRAAVVK